MSALSLTLSDLRGTLARIGVDEHVRQIAERRAANLANTLSEDGAPVEARVTGTGADLSIELTGPDLRDREYGTSERDGEAHLTRALLEEGQV